MLYMNVTSYDPTFEALLRNLVYRPMCWLTDSCIHILYMCWLTDSKNGIRMTLTDPMKSDPRYSIFLEILEQAFICILIILDNLHCMSECSIWGVCTLLLYLYLESVNKVLHFYVVYLYGRHITHINVQTSD